MSSSRLVHAPRGSGAVVREARASDRACSPRLAVPC